MTKPDREELEALARQLDHLTMDTMKQSGDDLREERDRLRGEVAALTQALAESRGQNKNWESAFGVKSLQEAISKFNNALTPPAPPQQER